MNLTYKIENYYPGESRLFVVYTPENVLLAPMGGWVHITSDMTEAQIHVAILEQAPYHMWEVIPSAVALSILGHTGAGTRPPTPMQPVVDARSLFTRAIQQRLDSFARERGYDGILSACTYVTSTVEKFALEGQRCVELRDSTWDAAYKILADVETGVRPMPTLEQVLTELPALVWPN